MKIDLGFILQVGPGWFRVFGYGCQVTDHRVTPPLFSERYGFRRGLHIGPFCLMWLGKDK